MTTTVRKIDSKRGERIKYVRTEILRIKSQEKLAERLTDAGKPTSRGAVGNWELGKEISMESLSAICEISGVDLNWLAYGRGEKPSSAAERPSPKSKTRALPHSGSKKS